MRGPDKMETHGIVYEGGKHAGKLSEWVRSDPIGVAAQGVNREYERTENYLDVPSLPNSTRTHAWFLSSWNRLFPLLPAQR